MLIHLIRHTTPAVAPGICYGQSDLELADTFVQEKNRVLDKIASRYDAVFTSPLRRCAQLAEYVNAAKRVTDARLMEYDFGDWELLPWDDINSETAKEWMNDYVNQPAPNGDSMLSMQQRVDEFWQELIHESFKSVAVVTHSGVQRIIHGHILSIPMSHIFRLKLDYGAVLEVNSDIDTSLLTVKHL